MDENVPGNLSDALKYFRQGSGMDGTRDVKFKDMPYTNFYFSTSDQMVNVSKNTYGFDIFQRSYESAVKAGDVMPYMIDYHWPTLRRTTSKYLDGLLSSSSSMNHTGNTSDDVAHAAIAAMQRMVADYE